MQNSYLASAGSIDLTPAQIDAIIAGAAQYATDRSDPALFMTEISRATMGLSPDCCNRVWQAATYATSKYAFAAREVMMGLDDFGGNQLVPIDSGDVFVGGFAATAIFNVQVQRDFRLVDIVSTNEMSTKFGLLQLSAAGFSSMSQGFSVANNPAAPALPLAIFTPDYNRYHAVPLLGREFGAQTQIVIQGKELTGNNNRFGLTVLIQLLNVCPPGRLVIVRQLGVRMLNQQQPAGTARPLA